MQNSQKSGEAFIACEEHESNWQQTYAISGSLLTSPQKSFTPLIYSVRDCAKKATSLPERVESAKNQIASFHLITVCHYFSS